MHFSSGFMSDTVSNWGYNTKIIAMIIENRFECPTQQRNTQLFTSYKNFKAILIVSVQSLISIK